MVPEHLLSREFAKVKWATHSPDRQIARKCALRAWAEPRRQNLIRHHRRAIRITRNDSMTNYHPKTRNPTDRDPRKPGIGASKGNIKAVDTRQRRKPSGRHMFDD